MTILRGLAASILLIAAISQARANSAEEFYRGKTLTIVVGMAPPDQHDSDARLLARYMGEYIPGNPTIIIQNMPGAGTLKAAQYLASVAPNDGSMIGIVQRGVMMAPLLGYIDVNFDPTKFTFIGSRAPETSLLVLWNTVPVKTIEEAKSRELILASAGGAGDTNTQPYIYNDTLGTRFKTIIGYPSGGEMGLAIERGEADGRAGWALEALRGDKEDWYEEKKVTIILQLAMHKDAELPNVPLAQDLALGADDRDLLVLFAEEQEIGFTFFAPAGIPADRAAALRDAYAKTMKDPGYIAGAKALHWNVNPLDGAQLEALVKDIYATRQSVVDRAKRILIAHGVQLR